MSNPRLTPYQILGIGPEATAEQIARAYQQALRRRSHPPQRLTQAFNELRSLRRRLEHDLLEPTAPLDQPAEAPLIEPPPFRFLTTERPPAPPIVVDPADPPALPEPLGLRLRPTGRFDQQPPDPPPPPFPPERLDL